MMSPASRWGLSFLLGAAVLTPLKLLRPAALDAPAFSPRSGAATADSKGRLTLVHIADLPPLGQEAKMETFIEEMAKLRPAAVLVGGDVVYGETRAAYDAMTAYFQRLQDLGIQVVIAPGNHERKAWPEYLRHFGLNAPRRVDIGAVSILVLDSGHGRDQFTPSQFRWFQKTLESLDGRTPVVLMHHPVFKAASGLGGEAGGSGGILNGYREAFIELCETRGVPIVLSGHWHCDGVFDTRGQARTDGPNFQGTKFVVTTSLGNELRPVVPGAALFHGYRVLAFDAGRLISYTEDRDGDGRPDPVQSRPLGGAVP